MLDRKLASGDLAPSFSDAVADLVVMAAAIEYAERRSRRAASPMQDDRRHSWREAGRREAVRRMP